MREAAWGQEDRGSGRRWGPQAAALVMGIDAQPRRPAAEEEAEPLPGHRFVKGFVTPKSYERLCSSGGRHVCTHLLTQGVHTPACKQSERLPGWGPPAKLLANSAVRSAQVLGKRNQPPQELVHTHGSNPRLGSRT